MENGKNTCYLCDTTEIVNEHCTKCNLPYCARCASKQIPLLYCFDCMSGIEVKTENPYITVKTDYDLDTGELVVKKSRCKRMQISGADWFFHERYMSTLSEEELRDLLEICRHQVIFLESELDAVHVRRRQEQIAQLRGTSTQKAAVATAKAKVKKQPSMQSVLDNWIKLAAFQGITVQQLAQQLGLAVPEVKE